MAGMIFKFSLKDMGAGQAVQQLAYRIEHPQQMLQEVGVYLMSSIQRNFQEGGRPIRWKPSRRAIDQSGQTLRDTGRLANSITMRVAEKSLKIGTNVKYAAIHHFGGNINKTIHVSAHGRYLRQQGGYKVGGKGRTYYPYVQVSAHSRHMKLIIPARPYLMIQDGDWPVIRKIGENYLIPIGKGA